MNERCDMCRALPTTLGLLLLAVAALANGCASGDVAEQPSDASSAEAAEDAQSRTGRSVYTCTLAQGLVVGSLEVFTARGDQPTCRIAIPELPESSRSFCFPAPGDIAGTCPDCLALKDGLKCATMP